jgi:hypothetical protein
VIIQGKDVILKLDQHGTWCDGCIFDTVDNSCIVVKENNDCNTKNSIWVKNPRQHKRRKL